MGPASYIDDTDEAAQYWSTYALRHRDEYEGPRRLSKSGGLKLEFASQLQQMTGSAEMTLLVNRVILPHRAYAQRAPCSKVSLMSIATACEQAMHCTFQRRATLRLVRDGVGADPRP